MKSRTRSTRSMTIIIAVVVMMTISETAMVVVFCD